jgi:D-lactate dehydrogenase
MKKKILVFDSKPYDIDSFNKIKDKYSDSLELEFVEFKLGHKTAALAAGYDGVCLFVHDEADDAAIKILKDNDVKLIALRCAGYNNVSLKGASNNGIKVVRVPEYSPYAVAEHAVALIMSLNRNTHRAYARVRENNFSLNGLVGFDMFGKTVGVLGTGRIGVNAARILKGFGCKVLAYDLYKNDKAAQEVGFEYVALDELYKQSDIITLHLPLTPETYHLINEQSIEKMKQGVVIINTSRGQLIDTKALIEGLKTGKVKAAGLDVYEEEEKYFFEDWSNQVVMDDQLARLLSFNNVIVTSHQAFFTEEALRNIAQTTVENIKAFFNAEELKNEVKA